MDFRSSNVYEEQDDVFYDELRRQVMQLTADDEDVHENKTVNGMEARKQGLLLYGPCSVPRRRCYYYDWPGIKEDSAAAPAWMLSLWRSGNGTGVFIPQTIQSERKNRYSRRKKNGSGITYRPVARTS